MVPGLASSMRASSGQGAGTMRRQRTARARRVHAAHRAYPATCTQRTARTSHVHAAHRADQPCARSAPIYDPGCQRVHRVHTHADGEPARGLPGTDSCADCTICSLPRSYVHCVQHPSHGLPAGAVRDRRSPQASSTPAARASAASVSSASSEPADSWSRPITRLTPASA